MIETMSGVISGRFTEIDRVIKHRGQGAGGFARATNPARPSRHHRRSPARARRSFLRGAARRIATRFDEIVGQGVDAALGAALHSPQRGAGRVRTGEMARVLPEGGRVRGAGGWRSRVGFEIGEKNRRCSRLGPGRNAWQQGWGGRGEGGGGRERKFHPPSLLMGRTSEITQALG